MAALMKDEDDEDEDAEPKDEPEEEEPAEEESEEESESEESEDETDSESSESEAEVCHILQMDLGEHLHNLFSYFFRILRTRPKKPTTIRASNDTTDDWRPSRKATTWCRPMWTDCRTKSIVCARSRSHCRRIWTRCYPSWASDAKIFILNLSSFKICFAYAF